MQMSIPYIQLKSLLGVIQTGTPISILDVSRNAYIFETENYNGENEFGDYSVEGVTLIGGVIVISAKK